MYSHGLGSQKRGIEQVVGGLNGYLSVNYKWRYILKPSRDTMALAARRPLTQE